MRAYFVVMITVLVILAGCSREIMPYKTLADTKPSSPTGAVVGVQKEVANAPVEEPAKTEATAENGPTCKDSDYGKFPTAAGTVRGLLADGTEYEMSDACFGNVLYEYYCEEDNALISKETCSRGCKNGFCV